MVARCMNTRAAQSTKCVQSVLVSNVPALLYSLPLYIAAISMGTYRQLNKIILEGCHDTSHGQQPVCGLGLLPAKRQPLSK
jgi:hypothetical protein